MIFGLCDACELEPATVIHCWLLEPERDRERCAPCDRLQLAKGEAVRTGDNRLWTPEGLARVWWSELIERTTA